MPNHKLVTYDSIEEFNEAAKLTNWRVVNFVVKGGKYVVMWASS